MITENHFIIKYQLHGCKHFQVDSIFFFNSNRTEAFLKVIQWFSSSYTVHKLWVWYNLSSVILNPRSAMNEVPAPLQWRWASEISLGGDSPLSPCPGFWSLSILFLCLLFLITFSLLPQPRWTGPAYSGENWKVTCYIKQLNCSWKGFCLYSGVLGP